MSNGAMRRGPRPMALAAMFAVIIAACTGSIPIPSPTPARSGTQAPAGQETASPSAAASHRRTASPTHRPEGTRSAPTPTVAPTGSPGPGAIATDPSFGASPTIPPFGPSPSGSAEPLPTPSAPGLGADILIFQDDFSDAESGFATGEFAEEAVRYARGGLLLELRSAARSTWSTRALQAVTDWPVARVEGRLESLAGDTPGYFGLVCARDNQTYYAALLFTGGGYVFLRIVDGASTVIARDETPIPGLPASGPVDMAFECASGEGMTAAALTLEVEGRLVATISDEPGLVALRRAGVYAESAPDGGRFRVLADDLAAYIGLAAAAPPPGAVPTPTPAPTPLDPALDALLVHVPAAIRPTCTRGATGGNGAVASVTCHPGTGIESVRYTQYISENLMDAAYRIDLTNYGSGATGSSCETGPANGPYTIGGLHAGQVLCFEHLGRAWVVWTDVRLDILASANRIDDSFEQLHDWWAEAGPVR